MIQNVIRKEIKKRVGGKKQLVGVVKTVDRIRSRVSKINQKLVPPHVAMLEMVTGFWLSQAITVAARLEIADHLSNGPLSHQDLALKTKTHAGALYRLLRTLVSYGIFAVDQNGKFELTPLSQTLRKDSPRSIRDMALFQGEFQWKNWSHLLHAVKTGDSALEHNCKMPFFDYLEKNPEIAKTFNGAMTNISDSVGEEVVSTYDFSGFNKVVDVGGGHGALLNKILEKNPHLKGLLFDLDSVIEKSEIKNDRIEKIGGSFFDKIPEGGDVYILKHIIHDWNDSKSSEILKHIRKAMVKDSKLLIIENVIPDTNEPTFGKLLDLEMLVATDGGKERTEHEFRVLLSDNHLKLNRIIPTMTPVSIIECERVHQ